jgi:hypothetical protein
MWNLPGRWHKSFISTMNEWMDPAIQELVWQNWTGA